MYSIVRLTLTLALSICADVRAFAASNLLEANGSFRPTLTFSESYQQRASGESEPFDYRENFSASLRVVVESDEGFASFNSATAVQLNAGGFVFDTTLGAAPDYQVGGDHATFPILEGEEQIGTLNVKWRGKTLTIIGSIKARQRPTTENSFYAWFLVEDEQRLITEASDASFTVGPLSGSRKVEVRGRSTASLFRIGPADNPTYEDYLWKLALVGNLDFTRPKVKVLGLGNKTGQTPQRYMLSTSPDAEQVIVTVNSISVPSPTAREDDMSRGAKERLWEGALSLEAGYNLLEFTVTDRSGNSSTEKRLVYHDLSRGVYVGVYSVPAVNSSSRIMLKVESGGAFTGTLEIAGDVYRFKGRFLQTFFAIEDTIRIPRRRGGTPIELRITRPTTGDFSDPEANVIHANIDREIGITAFRPLFYTDSIAARQLADYYTAQIEPRNDYGTARKGIGFLSIKVRTEGTAILRGKAADGTPFSHSGLIDYDSWFRFKRRAKAPFESRKSMGEIVGRIQFRTYSYQKPRLDGYLTWRWRVGTFGVDEYDCWVLGGSYAPGRRFIEDGTPQEFTPLGNHTAAQLSFQYGEVGEEAFGGCTFNLNHQARVSNVRSDAVKSIHLTINNKTGLFFGSFRVPEHTAPSKTFFGIIVGDDGRSQNFGAGFYRSKTDGGGVFIDFLAN